MRAARRRRRRRCVVVALLLGSVLLAGAPVAPPVPAVAAVPAVPIALAAPAALAQSQPAPRGDSDLTERYPLGDRTLAQPAPQPSREPAGSALPETPFETGAGPWPPLLVLVAVPFAVAAVALALRSFNTESVTRTQPRRRRGVGPTTYRLARLCGFRYSAWRDALVLRGVGERIGPVLKVRARRGPPLR